MARDTGIIVTKQNWNSSYKSFICPTVGTATLVTAWLKAAKEASIQQVRAMANKHGYGPVFTQGSFQVQDWFLPRT